MTARWTMLLLLSACRPDPGRPDYAEREPWNRDSDDGFLSTPLEEGETRLGIGVFYEGETTDSVAIDDRTTHFYVYESSFSVSVSDDRVEGYTSSELTLSGNAWWGGGVHWDTPRDLSAYETLHVALWTESLVDWEIGMNGGGTEARVSVASAGLEADGDWHVLEIPLEDFGDVDLSAVTLPLLLVGEGGGEGELVRIDDLFFRGDAP